MRVGTGLRRSAGSARTGRRDARQNGVEGSGRVDWTDGPMDGWTGGRVHGGWMVEWVDGGVEGWTVGVFEWVDGGVGGWKDE